MKDPRMVTLARNLIGYSVKLQKGERVLIENVGLEKEFVAQLVEEAVKVGGVPLVTLKDPVVQRALLLTMTQAQAEQMAKYEVARMSEVEAYIGVRSGYNPSQNADVPDASMGIYQKYFNKPVHTDLRVPKTKWVVLRYPTPSMAQQANMSIEGFEDLYFKVCNLNYAKMSKAMDALVARLEKTSDVRITGAGTDLRFSIQGQPAIKCAGELNIPDGEVFTAPVKDSVEGTLRFNTPSQYQGFTFENIELTFSKGKIVKATANDNQRIEAVLNTDEGARYIGEFAIGVNPYIEKPMMDTLFDEKICGSFHFTPGSCYDECNNGNKSAIHWDLVCIQRPEYGGGEMYFDGQLVRKDGLFVTGDLVNLNPESLK